MQRIILLLLVVGLNFAQAQTLKEAEEFANNYEFEKALGILRSIKDTTDIRVPLQTGYCYYRLGNSKLAIESYSKALQLDSSNRIALIQLGQLYPKNNRLADAKICFEKLVSIDTANSFYFKQYASFASAINDQPLAQKLFWKALQLNPRDLECYALLGNIVLDFEDYHSLDSLVDKGLAIDSLQTALLLLKAKSQMGQQHYKDALTTIGQLLVKNYTLPAYARLLGISYFQLDEYAKVVKCMNYLLESNLKSDWVYYYLGVSYRELHDLPRSLENMNKAIEEGITDNIGTYYSQLARTFEEAKDYKNAIHYYHAAYEKSKSKILLYHLARNYDVYYKDKATAIVYYKQYLASDDTIKIARQYSRHRLDRLKFNNE
jgi:tetratricopeptide (TPR) repeat protein